VAPNRLQRQVGEQTSGNMRDETIVQVGVIFDPYAEIKLALGVARVDVVHLDDEGPLDLAFEAQGQSLFIHPMTLFETHPLNLARFLADVKLCSERQVDKQIR
jgi:hypothetical protein